MKRNQFCSKVIRLLTELMFFYVLGACVSNIKFEKTELLIDVDEAIVGSPCTDESNIIADFVIPVDIIGIYTQTTSLRPVMNSQYICLNWETRKKLDAPMSWSIRRTRGTEHLLDKPPRGDEICINTS